MKLCNLILFIVVVNAKTLREKRGGIQQDRRSDINEEKEWKQHEGTKLRNLKWKFSKTQKERPRHSNPPSPPPAPKTVPSAFNPIPPTSSRTQNTQEDMKDIDTQNIDTFQNDNIENIVPQCLSWCKENTSPWKCNWSACSACEQCTGPPKCKDWCRLFEEPWRSDHVSKCNWPGCSGCTECDLEPTKKCLDWCRDNSTPWHSDTQSAKCTWLRCGACNECNEPHQQRSGISVRKFTQWACPDNREYIETFFEEKSDKPIWDCSCCPRYYGWWIIGSGRGSGEGCCKRINY